MEHVLVGKDLLLKVDQIASAWMSATDENGRDCVKVSGFIFCIMACL